MLLRDRVYQLLRDAILSCELQPGQELREQVLAERYHVSRSPIRDSLLRLELEKLVTVLPRQGYRVNPISLSDAEDVFGLRLLLEPACAAAAAKADDTALQVLDRFRGIADTERTQAEFLEYNKAFHRAVIDLSGNARMAAIAIEVDEQFQRLMRISLQSFDYQRVRGVFADHEAIIDAIQAHDSDLAARLSRDHTARAHARIREEMRLREQQPAEEPPKSGG
jgi:DNA-binding GntR family transcriptional regulator